MTEAALALSEQKAQSMGEVLSRMKAEKEEQKEQQSRLRKKQEEVHWRTSRLSSEFYVLKQRVTRTDLDRRCAPTQCVFTGALLLN